MASEKAKCEGTHPPQKWKTYSHFAMPAAFVSQRYNIVGIKMGEMKKGGWMVWFDAEYNGIPSRSQLTLVDLPRAAGQQVITPTNIASRILSTCTSA